jgi:hypothetical protein
MEAVRTSETSVDNHFTRQYIPEDNSEQTFCTPHPDIPEHTSPAQIVVTFNRL